MITAIDRGEREATQVADRSQDTKISVASNQRQQQQRRFKTLEPPQINRSGRSTASRLNEISVKRESQQVKLRTRRLTVCLLLLVGSISSLTPFLTLHLTNRVGLLLFESDILQLRSSLISVLICFTFLVILDLIIILFSKARTSNQTNSTISYLFTLDKRRSLLLQKLLKQCIGLLAITSVLAYLSLALIVPHIHQLQRTPFATFDCNANLITIENCQQQFATDTGENSLLDNVQQLLVGDLNGNGGRLAKRLECLRYNDENLERLRVPTRFLLSKCGLICEPQRQQLHQFSDDLNSNLGGGGTGHARQLTAPYSQLDYDQSSSYNSSQASGGSDNLSAESQLVSLKLCFSGEINGDGSGGSNYLRFCIENLAGGGNSGGKSHHDHHKVELDEPGLLQQQQHPTRDQTLTVGQLNALLSHRQQSSQPHGQASATSFEQQPPGARGDQSTHYVNPIVQFESHFKNWPHLTRASTAFTSNADGVGYFPSEKSAETTTAAKLSSSWCKFKPMPPFIVNNKPYSDIHCSLEHDYLMSTGSPLLVEANQRQQRRRRKRSSTPKIYLRKPSSPKEFSHSERCNIGCQVNILYQVIRRYQEGDSDERLTNRNRLNSGSQSTTTSFMPATSYYLPLKSCLIVRGDKDLTTQYYLWFRAIADASLLLTFILVDALLMLESVDTKQFQLEGKKVRLLGLLLAITLLPQLVASLFDLTASWLPVSASAPGRGEGQLVQFVNDRLIPAMSETFAKLEAYLKPPPKQQQQRVVHYANEDLNSTLADHVTREQVQDSIIVDNYLVPFFIYAVLMFAFAINSFRLPLVASTSPLVRVTSTEELGMVDKPVPSRSPTVRHSTSSKTKSLDLLSEPQRMHSLRSSIGAENEQKSSPFAPHNCSPAKDKSNSSQSKSNRPVVLFAMLTLFMGLQFNLSQITQTQILIETFNIQSDLTQQQHHQQQQQQQQQQLHQTHHHYERRGKPAAVSFVLVANSCGTIFILILALLFSDELSIFLAQLFPFKPISRVRDCENDLGRREHSLRFKKFIIISLVIYALRYFVLANMTAQMSNVKWLLAILFQSTELLNFPLTWFELASRSHEMLLINQQQSRDQKQFESDVETRDNQQAQATSSSSSSSSNSNIHLLVQSSLAFVYFALARLLALFVHSLHAGLYLHSDNVDWFIESFYGSDATAAAAHTGKPTMSGKQQPGNGTATATNMMDSLFIPLPSERQTYLYASRSFIRYNSLICLAAALGFLAVYCYERYRLWIDRKRLDLIQSRDKSPSERESDLIDERLSMDLMQIHSRRPGGNGDEAAHDGRRRLRRHRSETTVFTHAPRSSLAARRHQATQDSTATDDENERPRARIHFRYDLGLRRNAATSSSNSFSSTSSSAGAYYTNDREEARSRLAVSKNRVKHESRTIPMILEEDSREQQGQLASSTDEEVEQFTRTRTARMLVEDEEVWSLDEGDGEGDERERQATENRPFVDSAALAAARSPPPPGFADGDGGDNLPDANTFDLDPPPEFDEPSLQPPDDRMSRAADTRTLSLASEQQQQQKRRITFGPTTTFFGRSSGGGGGESGDQYSSASSTMATTPSARQQHSHGTSSRDNRLGARGQRHLQTSSRTLVSPEPSIDEEHGYEHGNNQGETRRDNNYRRETSPRTMLDGRTNRRRFEHHSERGASDDMDSIEN